MACIAFGALHSVVAAPPAMAMFFKDCEGCPEMVIVPAGSFVAGSTAAESAAENLPHDLALREQPPKKITITGSFAIGKFEVTRGQFSMFVRDTQWTPDGPCAVLEDGPENRWRARADRNWRNPGFEQTDLHPVVCVNVKDALAYTDWLSRKTGHRYRLPSGGEWEYAARADSSVTRPWSDQAAAACEHANGSDISRANAHNRGVADPARFFLCTDGHVYTAPVGSFKPNAFGLHDMLGNVLEWTSDCLNTSQADAFFDGRARRTGDCQSQINRGGAWNNSPKLRLICSNASRKRSRERRLISRSASSVEWMLSTMSWR